GAVAERRASADVAGMGRRPRHGLAPLAPRSVAIRCERSRSGERCEAADRRGFMELSVSLGGTGLVLKPRPEGLMHYHVIMRDGTAANPARVETFEMLDEAETAAQLLSERHIQPSW